MARTLAKLSRVAALAAAFALLPARAPRAATDLFGFVDPPQAHHSRMVTGHREARRHEQRAAREQSPAQGPFQVIVSIAKQQVTFFGQEGFIARADISTGMTGHATPMGVFTVISKARWHQSNIYSGAPMPYMQRITWSGIALHAGPRPGYPASHGCIRLPEDFAIRLFHTTKVGARVIVTRDLAVPVEIAHGKLFIRRKLEELAVLTADAAEPAKTSLTVAAKTSGDQSSSTELPATAATAADVTGTAATPPAMEKAPPRPISVFVSRKQNRVFVRQGFTPLSDFSVTIADPDRPFGTHVFTAMALKDDGAAFRWTVVSIPSDYRHQSMQFGTRYHRRDAANDTPSFPAASNATEVLDRITLPPEAIERISALIVPGSSLIVSDNALSDETDADTDFIVLTQ